MKNNFRKAALSTICMLIVAVMSLTGVTYAWFTAGNEAEVTGMKMEVTAAEGGIEVSKNGSDFSTLLVIDNQNKTSVKPVSTTDAEKFVTATFDPTSNKKILTALDQSGANVITQDLWLQNTGVEKVTVNLSGTYVSDIANTLGGTVAEGGKKTNIAKAARIAIFDAEGTLLGIIAPYMDATGTISEDTSSYLGVNNASGADSFEYEVDGEYTDSVQLKATTAVTIELLGLDGTTPQPKKITVVVWLEGQDADCTNPNAGGAFDIYLNFTKQ